MKKRKKIIIVGAGFAGLSAAYELSQKKGIDLHIFEQESEVGGRAHTEKIKGHAVDFGGFIIYPWYKRFNELIKKLKCKTELKKIPVSTLYYDIEGTGMLKDNLSLKLPLNEIIKLLLKTFPEILIEDDPSLPRLHAFNDVSVKDYLKTLGLKDKEDFYLKLFDTISQGYCYGPVEDYKMAFAAGMIHQNILHGDINSAFYFPSGTQVFAKKLAKKIKSNGGVFHFDTSFKKVSGNKITTNKGVFLADAVIFAHTPAKVKYTHFITATVKFEKAILVNHDENWGACFYRDNPKLNLSILSSINLEKLYPHMGGHINVNIKISNKKAGSLSEAKLFKAIYSQLEDRFPGANPLKIIKMVNWKKAMPIADEKFVDELLKKQGRKGHYFAGDFTGCPSMETAMMSGKHAADTLMADQVQHDVMFNKA